MLNKYYFLYYPVESMIHKMNSTIKVLIFLLSIISLFLNSMFSYIIIAVVLILQILLSKVAIKNYLKVIYTFRYIFVIIIIICALLRIPLTECLVLILKIIYFVEALMIITYTTSPIEISNGIENIIKPFNIFFIKTGKLTMKIMLGIKFIPILLNNSDKIFQSQSSRGFDYHYKTILGKFIVIIKSIPQCLYISNIQIKQIKLNMLMKLYNANKVRTNLNYNKIGLLDLTLLFIILFNIFINLVNII